MLCNALMTTTGCGVISYFGTAALTTMNPVAGLIAGCSYGFFGVLTENTGIIPSLALSILLGAGATKLLVPALLGEAITFKATFGLIGVACASSTIVAVAICGAAVLGIGCCVCFVKNAD